MSLLAEAMKEHFHPEQVESTDSITENQVVESNSTENIIETSAENTNTESTNQGSIDNIGNDSAEFTRENDDVIENKIISNTDGEKPNVISLDEVAELNIGKYTNNEFEKIDDLVKSYNDLKSNIVTGVTVMEMLDKQTQEKFGLSYAEIVAWKNIDYSNMNAFDVLAEFEEMNDPEVTDSEIAAELQEFDVLRNSKEQLATMIEDGEITRKEIDSLEAKFTKKTRNARQELMKYRDSLSLDDIKIGLNNPVQTDNSPTEQEVAENKELIKNEIKSLSGMKINLGSKDAEHFINFDITNDEKSLLTNTMTDHSWLAKRWTNEDGTPNRSNAYRDAYIMTNYNKMLKAAYNEGIAKGVKDHVVREDNITLKDGKTIPNSQAKDPLQDLADRVSQNYY